MKHLRRLLDRIDRWQRAWAPTAVVVAVVKKYSDDRGGTLGALVTFYGFLAVFPLLLLFVTVAAIVLGPSSHAEKEVVDSALSQFPVIGVKLHQNLGTLSRGNDLAFAAVALGLLWGSFGITNAIQFASERMWQVPRRQEANLPVRALRSLMLLGVMGLAVTLSSVLAGAATIGASHFGGHHVALRLATVAAAAVVNGGCYFIAFLVLRRDGTGTWWLVPGTLVGGLGWTALQAFGGYLIGHHLHRASELYGFFAIVLGLVFWLNLGAQLFLYSTELNVVLSRHLWPRHLVGGGEERAPSDPDPLPHRQAAPTPG